jgi:hypothetical protein
VDTELRQIHLSKTKNYRPGRSPSTLFPGPISLPPMLPTGATPVALVLPFGLKRRGFARLSRLVSDRREGSGKSSGTAGIATVIPSPVDWSWLGWTCGRWLSYSVTERSKWSWASQLALEHQATAVDRRVMVGKQTDTKRTPAKGLKGLCLVSCCKQCGEVAEPG